jgi:hypothetical protein
MWIYVLNKLGAIGCENIITINALLNTTLLRCEKLYKFPANSAHASNARRFANGLWKNHQQQQ